jgi:hypothetical protein
MKKILLAFSMIGMMILMNSCLDSGEQSVSGEQQLFYITRTTDGSQVAFDGATIMTSNEIKLQEPERWYTISWAWSSANGFSGTNIYNVVTTQIDPVPLGSFIPQSAPDPVDIVPFSALNVYNSPVSKTFGDYLLFPYSVQKADGESISLELYAVIDPTNYTTTQLLTIEARLNKTGSSTSTGKVVNDIAAVKMSALRSLITFDTSQTYKNINVKFKYYKDSTNPTESQSIPITIYND